MKHLTPLKIICLFSTPFLCITACTSVKNVAYFQDLPDTSKMYTQLIDANYEVKVQPDDNLEIIVNDINTDAAAPFNLGNTNPAIAPGSQIMQNTSNTRTSKSNTDVDAGYLVDKNGTIDFPVLGNLKVEGLTLPQVKEVLKTRLDKYLTNPIINVRLLNYKVTVLGEVARPSTYSIATERITVVDAIGMAGDLTIYGKRDNILLIREEGGKRKFIRLNLNSSRLFQSPYYYLKQNDIVYVEPNKSKIEASDVAQVRSISITTSVITLLIVIASRIF